MVSYCRPPRSREALFQEPRVFRDAAPCNRRRLDVQLGLKDPYLERLRDSLPTHERTRLVTKRDELLVNLVSIGKHENVETEIFKSGWELVERGKVVALADEITRLRTTIRNLGLDHTHHGSTRRPESCTRCQAEIEADALKEPPAPRHTPQYDDR